ncbi:matrix metalloproteinase-17-like [Heterodontus francisci]|uniref:matrix metalloproteinase-17-like n=1 Tax=Heterodontus francisci TaxID=7792 RepID=UPI00355BCBA5
MLIKQTVTGIEVQLQQHTCEKAPPPHWLTRYGYLPPQDTVTGKLQTWDTVINAIRSMQRFGGIEVTGAVDEATLNLTQTPRCSIPDVFPVQSGRRRRNPENIWKKKHISWKIQSYPSDPSLDRETIRALMFYGLKIWSDVSPLHFHEVVGERADIVIGFPTAQHGDSYPFDGTGGMVAHAFLPGEYKMAGSVHFDGEETWSFRSPADRGTDLFAVAVHEFGHALGLSHSASRNSIMRPYYRGPVGDPLQYQLSTNDRTDIERLSEFLRVEQCRSSKGKTVKIRSGYGEDMVRLRSGYGDDTADARGNPGITRIWSPESKRPSFPHCLRIREEARLYGEEQTVIRPGNYGPDRCRTSFDAAAQIRGETFLFKGRFFWRLTHSGHLASLRPARISRFWWGLPGNLNRVDALYERTADHRIVFFTGHQYWLFKDNRLQEGYPRSVTDFGLPAAGIDAAFTWAPSGKTYFFRDGLLWRYDEGERRVDPGYPSASWPWTELPRKIDSALAGNDGAVYFLSGQDCWRYEGGDWVLSAGYPRALGPLWMDCKGTMEGEDVAVETGGPEAGTSVREDGAGEERERCVCGDEARAGAELSPYSNWILTILLASLILLE